MFMRRVVKFVALFACVIAVGSLQPMHASAAAPAPISLSQVILPLQCTVDIVTVGPTITANLTPRTCVHSPQARQLLADIESTLSTEAR